MGSYETASNLPQPLVEVSDGTGWLLQNASDPEESQLNGVSCSSADDCVAVGFARSASGGNQPIVEAFNGAAWTAQTVPKPGGVLVGVST